MPPTSPLGRDYQLNFSSKHTSTMFDVEGRERKAKTMVAVLSDFLGQNLKLNRLLDVGASTGIIDNYLATHVGEVVGIDIDNSAIDHATKTFNQPNLHFQHGDAMQLDFTNDSFDVVVCSHVYEHVPDSKVLMQEIYRVLKPGGICYFSAGNRLMIHEPHYHLPFLSILPKPLAHYYLRVMKKGTHYYENHLTLWQLERLTQTFIKHDYTQRLIFEPDKFHTDYMINSSSIKGKIARFMAKRVYWALPGYIWLLQKPAPQSK